MTNEACKQGINTNVIAQHFGLQRSNISTILNELVKEERLSKTNTRPVLYYLPQKENKEIYNAGKLLIVSTDVRSKRRWLSYEGIPGYLDQYITEASSLTTPRIKEVDMLVSDAFKECIQTNQIRLCTYDEV